MRPAFSSLKARHYTAGACSAYYWEISDESVRERLSPVVTPIAIGLLFVWITAPRSVVRGSLRPWHTARARIECIH